jgi:2-dehydro-3-deoxygluconokinase
MRSKPFSIAMIGECMIELQEKGDGNITLTFGGDTFNTAAYMARLGRDMGRFVHYVSAVGDDPFSQDMAAFWAAQGVDHSLVMRRPGRRPGLYFIKLDPSGERHFYYWRGEAAVRECFECPGSDELLESLGRFSAIYLSGISLAVLRQPSRERLVKRLAELAGQGVSVYFDCNYRPLLWEDVPTTRSYYERLFAISTCVLVTVEELAVLGLEASHQAAVTHFSTLPRLEVVVKDGANPCTIIAKGQHWTVPGVRVEKVVDTTAAGDSFSATYLLGRALGLEPEEAAKRAHQVAAAVVLHRGAIIPPEATPQVFLAEVQRELQQ